MEESKCKDERGLTEHGNSCEITSSSVLPLSLLTTYLYVMGKAC